jgi:hypothetical protein
MVIVIEWTVVEYLLLALMIFFIEIAFRDKRMSWHVYNIRPTVLPCTISFYKVIIQIHRGNLHKKALKDTIVKDSPQGAQDGQ